MRAIRVLLVDDSPSVRAVLRRFFGRTQDIEVCGEAPDGARAVAAVLELQPQVVVMDLQMPVMDGYTAIERIMELRPTPIIVLSSRANRDQMRTAFEAIRRGAIDVLPKPEDTGSWEMLAESLPQTVRDVVDAHPRVVAPPGIPAGAAGAARARTGAGGVRTAAGIGTAAYSGSPPHPGRARRASDSALAVTAPGALVRSGGAGRRAPKSSALDLGDHLGQELRWVAIGASTGGPAALRALLGEVPASPPVAFLVVQHIAAGFELALADWLNKELPLDVRLARDGESPRAGTVRLAPGGAHLRLAAGGLLRLDPAAAARRAHTPSADELFLSCAAHVARQCAGVLLTGMGTDGVEGLGELRQAGALTLVQDEESCVVFGMPRVALERGAAAVAQPPRELARTLARWWRPGDEA